MSNIVLDLRGRKVAFLERGRGEPIVYLHGFADVHGVAGDFQRCHLRLCELARVIAPAHPGCAESDELTDGYGIDDVVFHYLELFDALGLASFDLIGHCVGGWIAAELAVRYPERVRRLALIGERAVRARGTHRRRLHAFSARARRRARDLAAAPVR